MSSKRDSIHLFSFTDSSVRATLRYCDIVSCLCVCHSKNRFVTRHPVAKNTKCRLFELSTRPFYKLLSYSAIKCAERINIIFSKHVTCRPKYCIRLFIQPRVQNVGSHPMLKLALLSIRVENPLCHVMRCLELCYSLSPAKLAFNCH